PVTAPSVRPSLAARLARFSRVLPLEREAIIAHTAPDRKTLVAADLEHLVMLGGGALAGGMLTFAGAAAVSAAALHRPWIMLLTAGLAGLSLAFALVATAARRLSPLLP